MAGSPERLVAAESPPHRGHDLYWSRVLSRRSFIARSAGLTGAVALGRWPRATAAFADDASAPKPIPGGSVPPPAGPHIWVPQRGLEPSTIFDFDGTIALADIWGSGEARQGSVAWPVNFNADMRFMTGSYVGLDGVTRQGNFGFI